MAGSGPEHRVADTTFPATALAPAQARAALVGLGEHLPEGCLSDAVLLISELVTNSVRHAASGPESRVLVRVTATTSRLRVEVYDWGPGFDAEETPEPRAGGDSGFGLHLVRALATRWGVDCGGTTRVWFELDG